MVPIVLGGDHSISFPSISGFASSKGKVGIIQFDAHHDLRNLEDGGPSNGTPFRSLLENDVITGSSLFKLVFVTSQMLVRTMSMQKSMV